MGKSKKKKEFDVHNMTPDEQLKGRGLVKVEDSILEFQTLLYLSMV